MAGSLFPDAADAEAYKQRVKAMFDARGQSYDTGSSATFHEPLAERLVEVARLRPGEAVLDLASGASGAGQAELDRAACRLCCFRRAWAGHDIRACVVVGAMVVHRGSVVVGARDGVARVGRAVLLRRAVFPQRPVVVIAKTSQGPPTTSNDLDMAHGRCDCHERVGRRCRPCPGHTHALASGSEAGL